MQFQARYFDGETALDHQVTVESQSGGLVFGGPHVAERRWSYSGLIAIESPQKGKPFRLSHDSATATRLVIVDPQAIDALVAKAPFLKGGINLHRTAKVSALIVGSLAATVLAGWLLLTLAPQQLAYLLPKDWVKRNGANMERAFVEGRPLCTNPAGLRVLTTFADRLRQGNPDFPEIELKVYDLGIVNAFALPGGHVILSHQLIEKAQSPEEVAGVLAHEIGHVSYKHPEAQMIRVMGVQVLLSLASGGGDSFGSVAAMLAILRYSRDAEREADAFARDMLLNAAIDPQGFKNFFQQIRKDEGDRETSGFDTLLQALSTHPMTEDRIAAINPLPQGVTARPVLTDADWQTLRRICQP